MNLQAVNSVFMNALQELRCKYLLYLYTLRDTCMRRTQDGTIPIRHQQIIAIIETIRASLYFESVDRRVQGNSR